MGTFANYKGKMDVPDERKGIFSQQMEKVLCYGGMMTFEVIHMFGCELGLLVPFHLGDGKESGFHYNYFEDNAWEPAAFRASDARLYSGKIGSSEFCDVVIAGYMLCELYDEAPGFAELDGDIVNGSYAVGWLNQLLGTKFSMKKRFHLWENAEKRAFERIGNGYADGFPYDVLMDMLPRGLRYMACSTEYADLMYIIHGTGSLDAGEIRPGTYPADILQCRNAVREFLDSSGKEDVLEQLWMVVRSDYNMRQKIADGNEPLSAVAASSLSLPARVLVYLAAEHRDLDFWRLWEQMNAGVYHDERMKSYAPDSLVEERRKSIEAPIKPVRTSEYLRQDGWFTFVDNPKELRGKPNYYLSDDDRLYWWGADSDEVIISEKMDLWLKELAVRHRNILDDIRRDERKTDPSSFLKDFLMLLTGIEEYYKRIYPFQAMFYEFADNGGRAEYRAAVELLRQLAEENREEGKIIEMVRGSWDMTSKNVTSNAARVRLKRYLAVMANPGLRKGYFGF